MNLFFSSPLIQASGQAKRHILQAIQFFCRYFGLNWTLQLPVLSPLLFTGFTINGPNTPRSFQSLRSFPVCLFSRLPVFNGQPANRQQDNLNPIFYKVKSLRDCLNIPFQGTTSKFFFNYP